jgi:hypothetical protein
VKVGEEVLKGFHWQVFPGETAALEGRNAPDGYLLFREFKYARNINKVLITCIFTLQYIYTITYK